MKTVRARDVESRALGESARRYRVLEPLDAFQLYRAAHRGPTAVYQLRQTQVLKDPSAGPERKNVVSLARFVRYKAAFVAASVELPWPDAISGVDAWLDSTSCTGENDARCLPLNTFSPTTDWPGLDEDQDDFDLVHGKGGHRTDERLRLWPKDRHHHGRDVDTVAGYELQRGFHWDVQAARSASSLWNAKDVWRLDRDGHLNVYPDATIRGGHLCVHTYEAVRPAPSVADGPRQPQRVGRPRRRSR